MNRYGPIKTVLSALDRSGLGRLMQPYLGGFGAILMLHHVRETLPREFDPNRLLTISPSFLDTQIEDLKREGYSFVSMDEMSDVLKSGKEASKLIHFTLDDGYKDNLENAAPVFNAHGVPYTIFVTSGFVDRSAPIWWEDLGAIIAGASELDLADADFIGVLNAETADAKNAAFERLKHILDHEVPETKRHEIMARLCKTHGRDPLSHVDREVMTVDELRIAARDPLCTIGAHTETHAAIARLQPEEALREMISGADRLAEILGERPRHFAFPFGTPDTAGKRDFDLARDADFETAVTTRHGVLVPEHQAHMHALPRISINGNFADVRQTKMLLTGVPTRLVNRGQSVNIN